MTAITTSPGDVPQPSSRTGRHSLLRVALASNLSLAAEAVGAALASRLIQVTVLTWPRVPKDDPVHRQILRVHADVALLIFDVETSIQVAQATALIGEWDGPWVVLTAAPAGVIWGALREAGAASVRPSVVGLDEIESLVELLAAGVVAPGAENLEWYAVAWRAAQERLGNPQSRVNSLSPRELQVLGLLRDGLPVLAIATRLGSSESTVRTQVRAVLRKLNVRSQLAAVALVRTTAQLEGGPSDFVSG